MWLRALLTLKQHNPNRQRFLFLRPVKALRRRLKVKSRLRVLQNLGASGPKKMEVNGSNRRSAVVGLQMLEAKVESPLLALPLLRELTPSRTRPQVDDDDKCFGARSTKTKTSLTSRTSRREDCIRVIPQGG
jgi:hypothetical protein